MLRDIDHLYMEVSWPSPRPLDGVGGWEAGCFTLINTGKLQISHMKTSYPQGYSLASTPYKDIKACLA